MAIKRKQSGTTPKVRVVNGRMVGKSIADPGMQEKISASMDKGVDGLTRFYVEQGVLTPEGKLSKRFGGN